ncbi:zinc ABC transporter substrate-binding protein [Catellatospora sp. IY07-71]|uniref:metal ABC transporter substrate-binding protein n=1 Tax=Catellatospora sp. IY07-71 TaxID=2728827 RepID=UPI001BB300BE|nr:metal ABC transporter substrate-binding protein [Catellatospora sp. IY07-71]BCJ70461.1 zinc ABC transporter substrate-binding protein [Catellatospora sp. IY07-71]
MLSRTLQRSAVTGAAALLALGTVAACSDSPAETSGRTSVVTGFYPLQFVAEKVGGPDTTVVNLAQPGAEPHDMELSPAQVGQVADAGLVLYLKGFQPQLDAAIEQNAADRAFDAGTVTPPATGPNHSGAVDEDHAGAPDPHVWLDPTRLAAITGSMANRLAQADPAHAADYARRGNELIAELNKLDGEFAAGLKDCQRREIVTSHAAFGYLADRYRLKQIALTGLTPEAEPTPQQIAAVAAEARKYGATTIFFETLVSPKVAETLAAETGAKTAVLDPLEGLAEGGSGDYLSVMRTNLATLRTALGCS